MKKRIMILLIVLILISVGLCAWINRVNYEIYDNISNAEINPIDGVSFVVDANRKTGNLHLTTAGTKVVDEVFYVKTAFLSFLDKYTPEDKEALLAWTHRVVDSL